MTNDYLKEIEERLHGVSYFVNSSTELSVDVDMFFFKHQQKDIQNLLALANAYREHIYSYDDPNIIYEIESKIFGDKS